MSSHRVSKMRHGSHRLPQVSQDVNPISELDATSWPECLGATRGIDTMKTTTMTKRTIAGSEGESDGNGDGTDRICKLTIRRGEVVRSDDM